jgi:hypothetical protein
MINFNHSFRSSKQINEKLAFIAHISCLKISKNCIFKAVANFENQHQICRESRVEIMKVLIVLILLVVFTGFGETNQDLYFDRSLKCDLCLGGAQYSREHIWMNLDVI